MRLFAKELVVFIKNKNIITIKSILNDIEKLSENNFLLLNFKDEIRDIF